MSFYTFVREPQSEWSDYHEFLYKNTFKKTAKIWSHPKLGPFFRCLRMHAKTNDKGNFMKILARNPFLFAEPPKQRQKTIRRSKKTQTESKKPQTEEKKIENPEIENNSKEARVRRQTDRTIQQRAIRQRAIRLAIIANEKKRIQAKIANLQDSLDIEDTPEAKTESSDTNSFREETKVQEETKVPPPLDQISNMDLKQKRVELKRFQELQVKRFQEFQKLDKSKIREILTELHDLHEEHVDLICSIERVKFIYDTQQKDNAPFVSANTTTYSEREARVEQMKQLENKSNLFLEIIDGDLFEDDYWKLFKYCNTLQLRREQIAEERKVLLRDDAIVSTMHDELYYVMRHDWSKTYGKPKTVDDLRNYIKFEIAQEELALCVEQTKMKFLQSPENSRMTEHFSTYFAMTIDSIEGHEDYLMSKITPDVRLDHIQEHLDTLIRVLDKDNNFLNDILEMSGHKTKKLQESYHQLLDNKAIVYFERGKELNKDPKDDKNLELNFLDTFFSKFASFLFSSKEGASNKKLAELDEREQQLDDEEMKYTLAGNLGLALDTDSFTKTVKWFRMRRRILQRRIAKEKIKRVLQKHVLQKRVLQKRIAHNTYGEKIEAKRRQKEEKRRQKEEKRRQKEEKRRQKEEADLEKLGTKALEELQEMTPWRVMSEWSPETKNIIRLIFGGIQLQNTVLKTVNECVHASERLEQQRRQSQTLKDAFERDVIRPVQEAYGDQMQADVDAEKQRVQARARAAAEGNDFAKRLNVEKFNSKVAQPMQQARQQAKSDKMQADAEGNAFAKQENARKFNSKVIQPMQQAKSDKMEADAVKARVLSDYEEYKQTQFNNKFQEDVAGSALRRERGINVNMNKCVDFTPFGLATGDGRAYSEANGIRTGGFAIGGECAHNQPPVSETGNGYFSTYFNYVWDGSFLEETLTSMGRLTDPEHRYGYDYFFKNYIQDNQGAKDAELTQEKWNKMSMADKAPHMKEFHRLYPSVGGVTLSAKPSGGGFDVTDQNDRILGEYHGRFDPHSASRLPQNFWQNIEYADGITPLAAQHPVFGGGMQGVQAEK